MAKIEGVKAIIEDRRWMWKHKDGTLHEKPEVEFPDPLDGRIVLTLMLDGVGPREADERSGKIPFGKGITDVLDGKITIFSRESATDLDFGG